MKKQTPNSRIVYVLNAGSAGSGLTNVVVGETDLQNFGNRMKVIENDLRSAGVGDANFGGKDIHSDSRSDSLTRTAKYLLPRDYFRRTEQCICLICDEEVHLKSLVTAAIAKLSASTTTQPESKPAKPLKKNVCVLPTPVVKDLRQSALFIPHGHFLTMRDFEMIVASTAAADKRQREKEKEQYGIESGIGQRQEFFTELEAAASKCGAPVAAVVTYFSQRLQKSKSGGGSGSGSALLQRFTVTDILEDWGQQVLASGSPPSSDLLFASSAASQKLKFARHMALQNAASTAAPNARSLLDEWKRWVRMHPIGSNPKTMERWISELPPPKETKTITYRTKKQEMSFEAHHFNDAKPTVKVLPFLKPRTDRVVLHHGTSLEGALSVARGIKFVNVRMALDFGPGFYLTANFDQAVEWGRVQDSDSNQGAVVSFWLTEELSEEYQSVRFLTPSLFHKVVLWFRFHSQMGTYVDDDDDDDDDESSGSGGSAAESGVDFEEWIDDTQQEMLKGRVCANVNDVKNGKAPRPIPSSDQFCLRANMREAKRFAKALDRCEKHVTFFPSAP